MAGYLDIFEKLKSSRSSSTPPVCGAVEFLVVGLGNPGKEYENTRHNIGFMAVDCLCDTLGIKADRLKFKSLCGDAMLGGKRVLMMKPSTFMNKSGEAVMEAMQFYKIPPEQVVILFDDIALEVGTMRIRRKGSDGGHNGMKNIIYLSGKDTFPRIKLGVGQKPHPDYDLAAWVLSQFTPQEHTLLKPLCEQAAQAVELMLTGKTEEAMNRFNK